MLATKVFFEINTDRAAGDVIDGEAIVINLVTGAYYSMQGAGGRVWAMIAERRSLDSMLEELVGTYDVDEVTAKADLDAIVTQLLADDLIRRADSGDDRRAVAPQAKQPYSPPQVQVFRDMQELLALDPPAPGMNQIVWSDGSTK